MRHFKEKHPDEELPPHMKEKILTAKKQGSDADRTDDTDEVRNIACKNKLIFFG